MVTPLTGGTGVRGTVARAAYDYYSVRTAGRLLLFVLCVCVCVRAGDVRGDVRVLRFVSACLRGVCLCVRWVRRRRRVVCPASPITSGAPIYPLSLISRPRVISTVTAL